MRYLLLSFITLFTIYSRAQIYELSLENSTNLKTERFVGVDSYNSIYTIKGRTLFKTTANNTIEYAALSLGSIYDVDLINPLKITVFYKESNTVVILDNTLNEITRVNFSSLENPKNVSHATTAGDRRLWIFNSDFQQIELFDYRLNMVLVEFPPIREIPEVLASNFNLCWVILDNTLFTYTIYGGLADEKQIAYNFEKLTSHKDFLIGLYKNQLFTQDKDTFDFEPLKISENDIEEFSLIGRKLYIYNGEALQEFSIKPTK